MNYTRSVLSVPYPKSYYDLGAQGIVEWEMATKGNPINEVFLKQLKSKSGNSKKLFSSIDPSGKFFKQNSFLSPDLFIFHTSRCGSSFAANYFATNPENRVLYEPNLLIEYVKNNWDSESKNPLKLKSIIQLLGCGALPLQKRLIIKLTSNSIRKFDEIHSLFPNVPKLFIYRDPKEVLISLLDGTPAYLPDLKDGELNLLQTSITHLEDIFDYALKNKQYFHSLINYTYLKAELKQLEDDFGWKNDSNFRNNQLNLIENQNSKDITKDFSVDTHKKQKRWGNISDRYKISIEKLEKLFNEISAIN